MGRRSPAVYDMTDMRLSPAGIRSLRKDRETALPEDNDTSTECAAITETDRPTGTRTARPNFRIT
ncbi:hypothetical protein [Phocaeicola plebeius]|uniref:hypothetical protein n=1 Tax=Phocaeicola plebeius TaxID=310297 RepID=UPI0026EE0876|nr:hypothetical protein [Phocaeicola plebeius]